MILRRVKGIGLISEHQYTRAYIKLVSQYGKLNEPLDDVIPHEKSSMLNKIIDLLEENNLSQKLDTYYSLGLPDDVLLQAIGIKKPDLPVIDNVIKLKLVS